MRAIHCRPILLAAAMLWLTSCTTSAVRSDLAKPPTAPPLATQGASAQTASGAATRGAATSPTARVRNGRSNGGRRAQVPGPALPSDWPAAVPLPTGTVLAATSAAAHWSVLILVPEEASRVEQSTTALYRSHGFSFDRPDSAHRDAYNVTFIAENRDHSTALTNLTIALTRR